MNHLPDYFNYEGGSPKVRNSSVILFSAPMKVTMDNQDNYAHLYYRSVEHIFYCAGSGCEFSNSPADHRNGNMIKHIHNKHPEHYAYEDLPDLYKTRKASDWQSMTVVANNAK